MADPHIKNEDPIAGKQEGVRCENRIDNLLPTPVLTGSGSKGSQITASQAIQATPKAGAILTECWRHSTIDALLRGFRIDAERFLSDK
jgi:hypothetical protein